MRRFVKTGIRATDIVSTGCNHTALGRHLGVQGSDVAFGTSFLHASAPGASSYGKDFGGGLSSLQ